MKKASCCFFVKALSKVPDYLFVHRWEQGDFKCDLIHTIFKQSLK